MPGLYTEADYENSVIELFKNDLGYNGFDRDNTISTLCIISTEDYPMMLFKKHYINSKLLKTEN